jgi:uncharacterized protein with HEPN domain
LPSSKRLDRLGDIVENCDRIARHVSGMSRDAYFADEKTIDEKTIDAVERCLQRISEAAYIDDIYPDTPWKNARGIGNILRHKYNQVTEDLIWASIEEDIPRLRKSALREIGRLKKSGRASRA